MMLATAAAVVGEDIGLKAPQAFIKGINWEATGPKLRKEPDVPLWSSLKLPSSWRVKTYSTDMIL
jgi:hypothetical protein